MNKFLRNLFGFKNEEQDYGYDSSLRNLSVNDVIKEFNTVKPLKETKEEIIVNEVVQETVQEEIVEQLEEISEEPIQEVQEEILETQQEEIDEVVEDAVAEEISEDAEVIQEIEEPKNEEVVEENEPIINEIQQAEILNDVLEELKPELQEEPQNSLVRETELVDEQTTMEVEVSETELPEETNEVEIDQTAENVSEGVVVDELKVVVDVVDSSLEKLQEQIKQLQEENRAKEIALEKSSLAKEVENDYAGVSGSLEEKTELIYELKHSELSENTKSFIFTALKSLSKSNLQCCEEIGISNSEQPKEDTLNDKVQKAMKEHSLTEGQALLYVRGERTLKKAKETSKKVNRK